jgi:hypothetical protein
MNMTELLALFREESTDNVAPYLWSDSLIYGYIDEAQKQFCRETFGIEDARTYTLSVLATEEWYALDPKILILLSASDSVTGRNIHIHSSEQSRSIGIQFDGRTSSTVDCIIKGLQKNFVRVWPVPSVNSTVNLSTLRLPFDIEAEDDFEIDDQHIRNLLAWVHYRAYAKHDADALDKDKSEAAKAEFLAYCAASKIEQGRLRRNVAVVRYGGL